MYLAIWIGVNPLSPCPIAAESVYPGVHTSPRASTISGLEIVPVSSPNNSIPVFIPNP